MKKLTLIIFVLTTAVISSCTDDETIEILPEETLSEQEKNDLLFIREEEKLARDVYLYSFDKYALPIFNNISKSEQQHMDQVLILLNTYGIDDPASTERGVFTNQTLQGLYNDLTAQSDLSLIDALIVGATIEDLDINDLDEFEDRTDKSDILNVYDKLKCGSRNHLRSYINQLDINNIEYTPQFISLEEFTEIINSDKERCGQ